MNSGKTRVGILISGRGSNMVALAESVQQERLNNVEIAVVISDQPQAPGLALAQARGLQTLVIERRGRSRPAHDHEILAALHEHRVQLVCLAGYMRLLSPEFLAAYQNQILNIHPSLLPAFPGLEAQRQALTHGVKWTGCTVHFVDQTLDGGPIIAQAVVPVLDDDDEASLSARILEEEHRLYSEALNVIAIGDFEIVGRRVLRKNRS